MDAEEFINLSTEEITQLLNAETPKVCACPINGTRRWYALEHHDKQMDPQTYLRVVLAKYVEIFRLLYSHGLCTVLTPIFGPELLSRGDKYAEMAIRGMQAMVTDPVFLDFVEVDQVRVRFYGDYVRYFQGTRFEYLIDLFGQLTEKTLHNDKNRLFFGVCGQDAAENTAEYGAKYYHLHKSYPTRQEIVANYYGEYVEPVSIFIGFDKYSVFDIPLLLTGTEDLYFMTSPTPYLTASQLRRILFDHLYLRRIEADYSALKGASWDYMYQFYKANHEKTMGVGVVREGIWYPLPQINYIDELIADGGL